MADGKRNEKNRIAEREREVRNKITAAFLNASNDGLYPESRLDKTNTDRLESDIRKRIKELHCLYAISSITQNLNSPVDEVIKDIADSIPSGMQYPEQTYVKVITYGNEYATRNYRDTRWKISADIREKDVIVGAIEIGYLTTKPTSYYAPFLDEEKKLLTAIADLTGIHLERRHSQQMFENLATSSPISIYISQDRKFKYVNPEFVKNCGFSEDELLSMNVYELIFSEDRQGARTNAIDMLKGKRSIPYEFRVINKDGRIRWVLESITSTFYNERRATLGSHIDITELKQVEEFLRESEEFSTSLLENAPYQINVINPDTSIRYVNPAFEKANGWTLEEIIGLKAPYPWWPKGSEEELLELFVAAIEKSGEGIIPSVRRDGSIYDLDLHWTPVMHDKELKYIVVNAIDITERKKAEESLKESEAFRSRLLNNSPTPILVINPDTSVKYINPAFEKLTGFTAGEVIGIKAPYPWWRQKVAKEALIKIQNAMNKEQDMMEVLFQKKNGDKFWVETISTPVFVDGEPQYSLLSWNDISERKQVESSLIKSEEKYRSLINNVNLGVFRSTPGPAGKFLEVNPAMTRITGYSREELLQMDVSSLYLHSEQRVEILGRLTSGQVSNELLFKKKDGTVIDVLDIKTPVSDNEGNILYYDGILEDITERKEMEERIQQDYSMQTVRNELLRVSLEDLSLEEILNRSISLILSIPWLSFESMGSIFLVEDEPDVLIMKAQNKLPGSTKQICSRVPFGKCICGLTASAKEIKFTDKVDSIHGITYEGITPHGHYCIPILYANRVLGVLNMYVKEGYQPNSRDEEFLSAVANTLAGIIERKRNENELRLSEERLRIMFESLSEGIMVYDKRGNILRFNDAILDMHGYDNKEELTGKSLFTLIAEREHAQAADNLKATIEAGHSENIRYTFIRKDGSEFPGELNSTALLNDSGELTGFVAISIDITDRIRSNEQLIVTDRLAAIGELSSGIAHEINNPLTGIIGFSDLLMEREIPADIRADLEIINKEARRTAEIVKKLLTFARRHPEKMDLLDINKIIGEVIEMRNYEQKVNNIEVECIFTEGLQEVIADSYELQQVFVNLVVNSEHFMTEEHGRGTLTITTERVGNYIRASFTDDGPGIQPENLKHVFDPFFTTKEVGKGTGLGLSICHGIITKYNGRLYAESEPGKGATFIVELPIPGTGDKEAGK